MPEAPNQTGTEHLSPSLGITEKRDEKFGKNASVDRSNAGIR
jgi:hypothetical protein